MPRVNSNVLTRHLFHHHWTKLSVLNNSNTLRKRSTACAIRSHIVQPLNQPFQCQAQCYKLRKLTICWNNKRWCGTGFDYCWLTIRGRWRFDHRFGTWKLELRNQGQIRFLRLSCSPFQCQNQFLSGHQLLASSYCLLRLIQVQSKEIWYPYPLETIQ